MMGKLLPFLALAVAVGVYFFIKHLSIKAANKNEVFGWDIRVSFILFATSVGLIPVFYYFGYRDLEESDLFVFIEILFLLIIFLWSLICFVLGLIVSDKNLVGLVNEYRKHKPPIPLNQ